MNAKTTRAKLRETGEFLTNYYNGGDAHVRKVVIMLNSPGIPDIGYNKAAYDALMAVIYLLADGQNHETDLSA